MAAARVKDADVLLIAMPWQALSLPSIQLGILQAVLERAGIRAEVRSLHLAFMEYCRRGTAGRPTGETIRLADYGAVALEHFPTGLGDWIFAVPPFRDDPGADARYLAYLRSERIPEPDIAKALAMRALVPAFLEECADRVLAAAPRIVGFTTTHSSNVPSLALARLLKDCAPSLAILFGGANCDGPMGAALHRAFPWVDVVVRGEAERILPGLVKDLLAGAAVRPQPGICYRAGGRAVAIPQEGGGELPMDEIPAPVYEEYFERLHATGFAAEISGEVRLVHETARGCWWGVKSHCAFCGLNGTSMPFRSKTPARAVNEIAALAARYGRLDFQIVDNILDPRHLREVFPLLREAGYDLSLFYETKVNLTRDQVGLLRAVGVDYIQAGLEGLSTSILKLMRKGVTALQNIRLLKWCAAFGIHVSWSIIYGLPGEPPEEYARMAGLVPSLTHLQAPHLCPLVIHRFSPYHERPHAWGLRLADPLPYYRLVYPVDGATLADLAHAFEHRHTDGRDPETYVAPLRRAIEKWEANEEVGYRALRYRRGPDFVVVRDRRPGLEPADYTFEAVEARIYLACEDGATAAEALAALGPAGRETLGVDEVQEFLDELVDLRLAYEEGGCYLALALPASLPEHK